jgi:pimeloyl-ACP methyl ester carboxylesterase
MLTVEKIAAILHNVFQHLEIKKATLCGHSMGGFTSQYLYTLCPDIVKRMILVATSCGGPFTKSEIPRLIADLGPNFWKRHKAFKEKPEEGINYTFSNDFMKNNPVKYKIFAHRFFEMRPRQSTIAKHFICASRFSSYDFLKDIKIPTLIVHGSEDKLITSDGAKILNEKISNSELISYDHCGHFPMIEKEDFYEKVLTFMEQKKEKAQKAS